MRRERRSLGRFRTILIAPFCVVLLYIAYVMAVFGALQAGVLGHLTRESEDFKLESGGGYSFWPGHIVLSDARLRYKDYNIEIAIEARELLLSWSLWPLFSKTIRIDEVRARDARFKMLHRVEHGHPNRQRLAAFPDIGFERPKVYDSSRPAYRVPPFRVLVESVHANVIEAWILEFRALGNFEVSGGFEVHENVTVFPSHADVRGAQLFMGAKRVSSRFDCDVRARVGPFPGREPIGKALAATDAKLVCDAELDDLSVFRMYWPDSEFLLEGSAKLGLGVGAIAGRLESSSASVDARLQRVGVEGAFLAGQARLALEVDSAGVVQVDGGLRGDQPPESLLDVDELRLMLKAEQPKALEVLLRTAQVRIDGLGVRDPTVARRLSGDEKTPLVKVEQTRLELEYVAPRTGRQGTFELQSRGGIAVFPAVNASISCAHEVLLHCSLEEERARCPGSTIACTPLTVSKTADEKSTIAATLVASSLERTPEGVSSEWRVSLGNPKKMLQATVANDVWAEIGLAVVPLGLVEGKIRVNRRQRTVAGTVDYAHSGPVSVQGSFLLAESFMSRWRVDTPVGRFGVQQTHTGTTVTPFVGSDWGLTKAAL